MKRLSGIFLGVAIASSAFSASAQTAPDTLVDAQMEKRLFMLSSAFEDDKAIIERGFSDDAVGVVCDWKMTGRIDPVTQDISVEVNKFKCEESNTLPDAWAGGRQIDINTIIPGTYNIVTDSTTATVTERFTSNRNSLGVSSIDKREWLFAENKVCLTLTEGQYRENGDFNVYVNLDGGCFAIPDNSYAQKMRQALKPGT